MTQFVQPVAVFQCSDGAEFWIREYCGRFQWIGPWTIDALGSEPTLAKAIDRCRKRAELHGIDRVWTEATGWVDEPQPAGKERE